MTDESAQPPAGGADAAVEGQVVPRGPLAREVSREIVQLFHRYTGRGPTKARAIVNTNQVAVVLEETLTRGELNLVAAGQADAVLRMRRTYHESMHDEIREAIERIMNREVRSVMADIDLEENVAVLFIVLSPRPETGHVEIATTGGERADEA